MKNFLKDFKDFALRGNVIDLAVGMVIGGAFSSIVTSLVNDIIMPLLSMITGTVSIKDLNVTIPTLTGEPIVLAYGLFLQAILDFLLIALSIFFVIKIFGAVRRKFEKKKAEEPQEPPKPSNEEVLLTEIRDLLKEKKD